jgi:hypothetical protein
MNKKRNCKTLWLSKLSAKAFSVIFHNFTTPDVVPKAII